MRSDDPARPHRNNAGAPGEPTERDGRAGSPEEAALRAKKATERTHREVRARLAKARSGQGTDENPWPFLARGALDRTNTRELDALKRQIQDEIGLQCASYKESCLRRRLAVRMRARGVHRYGEYGRLLKRDAEEYERLRAAVTINVSKFFRNNDVWDILRADVMPALFSLDAPSVRIWSAGSASGEEPYSIAITLLEYAREHGLEERLDRFEIRATDVDADVVEAARRGEYGKLAMSETPAELRERWFEGDEPPYRLREEVKRLVRFEVADLLSAASDPPAQHLVFCRNVIIYFERSVQEALFERFRKALVPGGWLVLGKAETLLHPVADSFRSVPNRQRVYQRI